MPTNRKQIIILGEIKLVIELASFCHSSSYSIVTSPSNDKIALPDFCLQKKQLPKTALCAFELTNTNNESKKRNLLLLEKTLPTDTIIYSSSVATTVTEQSHWLQYPERLIGISALPTLLKNKLIEVAISIHISNDTLSTAKHFFTTIGKETSIVQDRVGMVLPRILCMLINEAYFALMEDVTNPADIDLAMKLGTNYPQGPIQWSQLIGLNHVVTILDAIHQDSGEERYRVAPLLRQLARNIY